MRVLAQEVERLAVELVAVEVLELAVRARRVENAKRAVKVPERPTPTVAIGAKGSATVIFK